MLYVLDLDDTLYLERDFVRSGFHAVAEYLKEQDIANYFYEIAWSLFRKGARHDVFNQALNKEQIYFNDKFINKLVNVYRNHIPDIELAPDADTFFADHRIDQLALITDGNAATQWKKINVLELKKYFNIIIVTDDYGRDYWKPDRRVFKKIQGAEHPENCVHIADNPAKDFIAPRQLGWRNSIRVKRPQSLHENIPTPTDCLEVNSLTDVSKYEETHKQNHRPETPRRIPRAETEPEF